jgi:hypothetical protein
VPFVSAFASCAVIVTLTRSSAASGHIWIDRLVFDVLSQRPSRSNRDRRRARGARFLRPNHGIKRASPSVRLGPTQRSRRALSQAKSWPYAAPSGLLLRSNRTDATLQACAYSGQIVALHPIKRTSSSVKSGPTPRSRRALTQAKSGLMPRQADFIFGHDDK